MASWPPSGSGTQSGEGSNPISPQSGTENMSNVPTAVNGASASSSTVEQLPGFHWASSENDSEAGVFPPRMIKAGIQHMKDRKFGLALDLFEVLLHTRMNLYGELSPKCLSAYCHYVAARLFKGCDVDIPVKDPGVGTSGKDCGEAGKKIGAYDGDIDTAVAWKILGIARAIVEKPANESEVFRNAEAITRNIVEVADDSLEKVEILSILGEAASERKEFETALADYGQALNISEDMGLFNSRRTAEILFNRGLCLEGSCNYMTAKLDCQRAVEVCEGRLKLLKDKGKSLSGSVAAKELQKAAAGSSSAVSAPDEFVEVQLLTGLRDLFANKFEELDWRTPASPSSSGSPHATRSNKLASRLGTDSSSESFGGDDGSNTNGKHTTTFLGVAGRGVKRLSTASEIDPAKRSCGPSSPSKT